MKGKAQMTKKCPASKYQNSGLGSMRTGGKNAAVSSMMEAGSKSKGRGMKKY